MTVAVEPEQLAAFVGALFRYADDGTWISLRAFRDDIDNEPPIAIQGVPMNGDLGSVARAADTLARQCAEHEHRVVFCPPIATFDNKSKATEAALRNGLALSVELDADAERAAQRLQFLLGPATVVVASGGTYTDSKSGEAKPKLHVHWRLKEPTRDPEAHKRLKQARAMATALVGGDASNKPIVHCLRWPGSVHRKGEPKLCRIVACNPDAEIDLQDALGTLFDIQPEFRKTDAGGGIPGDGEDRETPELIRALVSGEDFHSALLALAMRYLKRRMAAEHVTLTLRGLMAAVPVENRGAEGRWQARFDDIPRMVRQAEEKLGETFTPDDSKPPSLIMLDDCQLDTEIFWAIEDTLPRCSMMMTYARGGSGKTYLMTSVAFGIGTGQWFDRTAEHGAVLICAFERPQDTEDRLAALRDLYGHHDTPVALLKLGGKYLDADTANLIIQSARQLTERTDLPVRAIIIDTVSAALGGKEDDDNLGRLRRLGEHIHADTGALVIWIHHEGKGDCMGPRGHLALADACAVWWHVEEREDGSRVVHVAKANRGPDHVPLFAFKLVPFEAGTDRRGKTIRLCEVQITDLQDALGAPVRKRFGQQATDHEPRLGSRQKLMLRLLRKLAAKHPEGVEIATLRSAFVLEANTERQHAGKQPFSPDHARTTFNQTLASLRDRQVVEGPDHAMQPSE